MALSETELMLKGYGLTTAEFIYHMPDHVHVLNSFIWQEYDLAPDHPRLFDFIAFWQREIEGPLHSVRFAHRRRLSSGEWRHVRGIFRYGEEGTGGTEGAGRTEGTGGKGAPLSRKGGRAAGNRP